MGRGQLAARLTAAAGAKSCATKGGVEGEKAGEDMHLQDLLLEWNDG